MAFNFRETSKLLKLRLDKRVVFACQYLEDRSYRFAVDYGYKTAIKKAAEIEACRVIATVGDLDGR